jgi:hypothetical protein
MEAEQLARVLREILPDIVRAVRSGERTEREEWEASQRQIEREWQDRRQKEQWAHEERARAAAWKREDDVWGRDSVPTPKWYATKIVGLIFLAVAGATGSGFVAGQQAGEEAKQQAVEEAAEEAKEATIPLQMRLWQVESAPETAKEVAREYLGNRISEARANGGVVEVTESDLEEIRRKTVDRLSKAAEREFDRSMRPEARVKMDKAMIRQHIQMPLQGVRVEVREPGKREKRPDRHE